MFIRSILTAAIVATLALGATAEAGSNRATCSNLTAQTDCVVSGPGIKAGGKFASDGGLGTTR